MPTVSQIISFLESYAPVALAEEWDNVGLIIGRPAGRAEKIMTCLSLTPDVAAEAVSENVQMIVTHHPPLFRGTKKLTDENSDQNTILTLIENGIAVYSPHTAFDSAADGINQKLAMHLGLQNVAPLRPNPKISVLGAGRWGELPEEIPLKYFLEIVAKVTRSTHLEFVAATNEQTKRVAVACGAAGDFLDDAIRLKCDTFVVGEARFHSALQARSEAINLVVTGHYSSERPAVEELAETISSEFPESTVFPSHHESSPLRLFLP
ncbi:MAG: Nif3-like dinuclear metal center hexameric protein [Planctomycetaceae bacterium]|nr:Nif3-like dinuclear metal center hexameric protein [Planctomycetaceae bacterium]